jgi:hypothetical protein
MIQIRYETNAEKCIKANKLAYKHKPRYIRARARKFAKPELVIDFGSML